MKPPTMTTREFAEAFNISQEHARRLARRGEAPIEPLRLGRSIRWPRAKVERLLGIETSEPDQ